jgi:hypothetical protein
MKKEREEERKEERQQGRDEESTKEFTVRRRGCESLSQERRKIEENAKREGYEEGEMLLSFPMHPSNLSEWKEMRGRFTEESVKGTKKERCFSPFHCILRVFYHGRRCEKSPRRSRSR